MIFADYMEAAALWLKEPEAATANVRFQADIPYVAKDELEHVVVMALNQVLGEVTMDDWDSFSSDAVKVISGGNVVVHWSLLDVPYNLRRILAASIDAGECVQASIASFMQVVGTSSRYSAVFALQDRTAIFRGTSITLTVLVEPTMDTWMNATKPILPPGYDLRVLDVIAKRILISDYVLEWGG